MANDKILQPSGHADKPKEHSEIEVEGYREYPAGRGKKFFTGTKHAIEKHPKRKGKKKGWYPIHFDSKTGQAVSIGIFRKKAYPTIFPEGATLYPHRINELLATALLLRLISKFGKNTMKMRNQCVKERFEIPKEIVEIYHQKLGAYLKWLKTKK